MARRFFFVLALLAPLSPCKAEGIEDYLYKAEIIVTGRGEEERERGFREGLREIILKLSGEYGLKDSSRLEPFLSDPGRFIREFTYEDRMKGIPVHDEQGTRDRPFFLRMTADAGRLDAALATKGITVWRGRPEFELLVTVRDARGIFLAGTEDGSANKDHELFGIRVAHAHYDGFEQREVIASIAVKHGLTITLPPADFKPSTASSTLCPLSGGGEKSGCVRLRVYLEALPSGRWQLDMRPWSLSPDAGYVEAPECFHLTLTGVTYDRGLRDAVEAAVKWAREEPNAAACGVLARNSCTGGEK